MEGGIYMNKNEQVDYEILVEFAQGRKSRAQTARLLGVSQRAVTRRARKIRLLGVKGIKHGNYAKVPSNKIPKTLKAQVLELIKTKYFDFNTSHALELLSSEHNIQISYTTLLGWCRKAGLSKGKRRRASKARVYRERMSNEGCLLQMDGSHHDWNGKDRWCLISVIDDATSNIPAGQFYEGETSWNCMKLLRKLFETRGIPQFFYTDGAGWAGGGGKRQNFSQVVRACEELGVKIIRASSAQAKGRIERSYKTIQDRLIPEMRLKEIHSMKDANRYLEQVFWPSWNERFTVDARENVSRYRGLRSHEDLDEILCMKYERQVNNDHTFSFLGRRFKLDPGEFKTLRQKKIMLHQYENGSFRVFHASKPLDYKEIIIAKRRWS